MLLWMYFSEFPGIFALETSSASSINELLSKTVKDSLKGSTLSSLDCSVNSGECP